VARIDAAFVELYAFIRLQLPSYPDVVGDIPTRTMIPRRARLF